ncbi:MAG: SDR family oxidoreductase [Anaeroplasmataceae bacterium]|nr:SDR family oxidoreductase [Anaeroplasmataceae bacterium]
MKNTVLITGATGGIGRELAKQFASAGDDLILVGRNEEKLQKLMKELLSFSKSQIEYFICDFRKESHGKELYEMVKQRNKVIDILVNAAGFGLYNSFLDEKINLQEELIEVNLVAMLNLCYFFGRDMQKRKKGYIINFASISGFFPGPFMATYYASKAFVLSFSLGLYKELKKDNIQVLAICPGVIDTPFYRKANAMKNQSFLLERMPPESPERFAKKAYRLILKRKEGYKVISIKNKILIFLSHFVPRKILSNIIAWIQAKK